MNYASQSRRPNPAALAGALGIPAAVGALLVVGLAVTVAVRPPPPPLTGFTVTPTPIPPPPPTDPVEQKTSSKQQATTTTPNRPEVIQFDFGSTPIGTLPGVDELTGPVVGPVDFGIPGPSPSASPFDPVGARPKNNPGRWVVDNDYRPSWLRQGLLGNASFTLAIDAAGRVSSCTITRSTGHSALDTATCELVTKRARFDAARDGTGKPVAGNFSGSITWNIPD
jgi:periplasmic protein TonB